jgi:hypothetical protein
VDVPRVVLRSWHQTIVGAGFGAFVLVVGVLGASQDTYIVGRIGNGAAAVVLGSWTIWTFVRTKLIVTPEGVRILNLGLRSTSLPWSQITGFRLGRYKRLSAVCMVDLIDGTSRHVFAIQLPRLVRSVPSSKEMRMIGFLNAEAAAHGAPIRAVAPAD